MMSLLDYAEDVGLSIEELKKLCDRLSIAYDSDDYMLSDTEITLLDNAVADSSEDEDERDQEERSKHLVREGKRLRQKRKKRAITYNIQITCYC